MDQVTIQELSWVVREPREEAKKSIGASLGAMLADRLVSTFSRQKLRHFRLDGARAIEQSTILPSQDNNTRGPK